MFCHCRGANKEKCKSNCYISHFHISYYKAGTQTKISRKQTMRYCGKYLHEKQSENWRTLSSINYAGLYTQANINVDLNEPLINGEYSRLKGMIRFDIYTAYCMFHRVISLM